MRPVITPDESRRLDATSTTPVETLMERAGYAVAVTAAAMGAGYGSRVAVLVGTGNNGGDGYVAARHLHRRGADVAIHSLGYPKGEGSAARKAGAAAAHAGVQMRPLGPPERTPDLVIDALFGTGFHGELPHEVRAWSDRRGPTLSVDIPSGLDGLTGLAAEGTFFADRTVTFGASQVGHHVADGPDHTGRLEVVDIGLPDAVPEMWLVEESDVIPPRRRRTSHKWSVGSVAVVGGAPGIAGAPVLAARAALLAGAGAVTVVGPATAAMIGPDLLHSPVGKDERLVVDDLDEIIDALERFDVAVVGPGLGEAGGAIAAGVADRFDGPLLLDADALHEEVLDSVAARSAPTILTPHAGEFRRLTGEDPTLANARDLAAESDSVVLLKGSPTIVAGRATYLVDTGSARLATIGTGDVLAGTIGAFVARGMSPTAAAYGGAWWHGRASRTLKGPLTPSALADEIGRLL